MEVTEADVQEAMKVLDPRVHELLVKLVNQLLLNRPSDSFDTLEQMISELKKNEFPSECEQKPPKIDTTLAKLILDLARPSEEETEVAAQVMPWTDCREQVSLLKRFAGVCIPEDTTFLLSLAIKQLRQLPNIYHLRFWGCVGFRWYVLEAELTPQGFAARAEEMNLAAKVAEEKAKLVWEERKKEAEEKGEAMPDESPDPEIPTEVPGTGVNAMVYLVSENPGLPDSWTWLPDLTPKDVTLARKVVHYPCDLEGTLKVSTLTPALLLRAQIARINSSTRVAPQGMFRMKKKLAPGEVEEEDEDEEDEEEEEEEEGEEEPKEARLNLRFKSPPLKQLLDQGKWVHTTPHILQQQARVKWWNPNPDAEEEDEDEDEEGQEKSGPEKGPKPLAAIGQDVACPELVEGFPTCWALRSVSVLEPPAVVARSLTWPGSITVFSSGRLEHVYIGSGTKASSRHFCPRVEFQVDPEPDELVFADDPSVLEEKAAEAAAKEDENEEDEGELSD